MWVCSGFIWLSTASSGVIHKGRGFVKDIMGYSYNKTNEMH